MHLCEALIQASHGAAASNTRVIRFSSLFFGACPKDDQRPPNFIPIQIVIISVK